MQLVCEPTLRTPSLLYCARWVVAKSRVVVCETICHSCTEKLCHLLWMLFNYRCLYSMVRVPGRVYSVGGLCLLRPPIEVERELAGCGAWPCGFQVWLNSRDVWVGRGHWRKSISRRGGRGRETIGGSRIWQFLTAYNSAQENGRETIGWSRIWQFLTVYNSAQELTIHYRLQLSSGTDNSLPSTTQLRNWQFLTLYNAARELTIRYRLQLSTGK